MIDINKSILLGSGSPRRKLLLKELGFNFRTIVSNTNEIPLAGQVRQEIAEYLSEEKAMALKEEISENEILITADTIVWLDSAMLGKPKNDDDAYEMLSRLSSRTHQVYTGITLLNKSSKKTFSVKSNVSFKKLDEALIQKYISEYKPFDKAGSYGAQECLPEGMNPCSEKEIQFMKENGIENFFERTLAPEKKHVSMIENIDGSYFNVMGLPIVELVDSLNSF